MKRAAFFTVALGLVSTRAWASPPLLFSFTGTLSEAEGGAVADATHELGFALYGVETGGTALWQEDVAVDTRGGVFSTELGASSAIDVAIFVDEDDLWLEIAVDGEAMAPRLPVASVPWALVAGDVACTGCVGEEEIDPAALASLGPDYSVFGSCDAGDVVTGVDPATGAVECAADAAGLALDGCAVGEFPTWDGSDWVCGDEAPVALDLSCVDCVDAAEVDFSWAAAAVAGGAASDLACADCVSSAEIANGAVGAVDLAAGAVGTAQLADSAVTSAKILNGTILFADLAANGCVASQFPQWNGASWACGTDSGDATPDTIADDGLIQAAEIAVGAVGTVQLADSGVTSAKIANGTILFADWASNGCALNQFPQWNGASWVCAAAGGDSTPDTIADDGVITDAEASDQLSISNTRLYAPNGAGNVGISTAAPTSALEVDGRATIGNEGAFADVYETELLVGEGNLHVIGNENAAGQAAGTRTRLRVGNAWNYAGIYAETASNGASHSLMLGASDAHVRIQGANAGLHWSNTGTWAGSAGWDPNAGAAVGLFLEAAPNEAAGLYLDGDMAVIWSPGDPDLLRVYDEDGMIERLRVDGIGNLRVGVGTVTGCVQDGDGTVIAGVCASDARLKRDVRPFEPLLDALVRLQPVHFHWRPEVAPDRRYGPSESFGLVAQDARRVLPELVVEDPDGFLAVRYNELPLLMLQGMREEHARVDGALDRARALERENRDLRSRVEKLERAVASLDRPPRMASIAGPGPYLLLGAVGWAFARLSRRRV